MLYLERFACTPNSFHSSMPPVITAIAGLPASSSATASASNAYVMPFCAFLGSTKPSATIAAAIAAFEPIDLAKFTNISDPCPRRICRRSGAPP